MCRISKSFDTKIFADMRWKFATVVLAASAAALLSYAAAARADNVSQAGVDNPPLQIDLGCAKGDLELLTLIERNGNSGLSTIATLLEAADIQQTARAACEVGDVENGLALYDMAIRRLENPSDIARR